MRVEAALLLLCLVAGAGASGDHGQPAELGPTLPVCLVFSLFDAARNQEPNQLQQVTDWLNLRRAKAAMLAVDHINAGDCSLLGDGCQTLLDTGSGGRVRLTPLFSDLHGRTAAFAPLATQRCIATDAQMIVGATTSEQSNLVAAFVGGLGEFPASKSAGAQHLAQIRPFTHRP